MFRKIAFFYRKETVDAQSWEARLKKWLAAHSNVEILPTNRIPTTKIETPNLLIVLGGDGTIIEAAQKFLKWNPPILGLNLGHVGFLASVREPEYFIRGLHKVLKLGTFHILPRMMMRVKVLRGGKSIFTADVLNDIAVKNLTGVVEMHVAVDGYTVQGIRGDGVLVATPTGSTAYNLSAHGPIVMPDIKCFIITKLLDHHIPTPSLVVKRNRTISLIIESFRKTNRLMIPETGGPTDVVLITDSGQLVALRTGDEIRIKKSKCLAQFIEIEPHYFFKSLQQKFGFR